MRSWLRMLVIGAVTLGLSVMGAAAERAKEKPRAKEGAQTKTGVVRKVDVAGKKIVVMVARELTFTVTDDTKIVKGEEAKTLADIQVGGWVTVEYTRTGDTRTATVIAIIEGKPAD